MISKIDVRSVANLTSNDKRSISRELAYIFSKLSELAEITTTVFDKGDIRTLLLAIDSRPARIRAATGFSPSGAEPVIFDTADFDVGGYFNVGEPDGVSFPFGGVFRVRAYASWGGAAGLIQLMHNGTTLVAEGAESAEVLYFFKAGDFIQMFVDEDVQGGAYSPVLEIEFIRPSPNPPELS